MSAGEDGPVQADDRGARMMLELPGQKPPLLGPGRQRALGVEHQKIDPAVREAVKRLGQFGEMPAEADFAGVVVGQHLVVVADDGHEPQFVLGGLVEHVVAIAPRDRRRRRCRPDATRIRRRPRASGQRFCRRSLRPVAYRRRSRTSTALPVCPRGQPIANCPPDRRRRGRADFRRGQRPTIGQRRDEEQQARRAPSSDRSVVPG